MTPADAASQLRRALARLEVSAAKGPTARRNARSEFARALRRLRAAVDVAFPRPASAAPRKARASPEMRLAALRREGWDDLSNHSLSSNRLQDLAVRGIRVKRISLKHPDGLAARTFVLAPPWTKGIPARELRAAQRSHQMREAIAARVRIAPETA